MSNSYLLKSHPNKLLIRHLEGVAFSSKRILEDISGRVSFGTKLSDLERCTYIIACSHDIGKGTSYFQNYLSNDNITFDPLLKSHSIISSHYSSWVIMNDSSISEGNRNFLAVAASLVVQGHHGSLKSPMQYLTRLYDFISNKDVISKQITAFENIDEVERITRTLGLQSFVEFSLKWQEHYDLFKHIAGKFSQFAIKGAYKSQYQYFIVNLLYSILLDADRMDAANLNTPERIKLEQSTVTEFVQSKFNTGTLPHKTGSNSVNINRFRKILFNHVNQSAVDHQFNAKKNIFTLTAPTGLGKTITALNFAVKLRSRVYTERGFMPRIIYVAPFISILDQNIEVFKEIFKDKGQSNLLLSHHHLSPVTYSKIGDDDLQLRHEGYSTPQSELLIQGWNAEIIVTTFVQFFYTILGRYTSQLRRLDNLIGSIIILDEVQSIPFEYWGIVRSVLRFLSEEFSMIMIMMTATQPLIFNRKDIVEISPTKILYCLPQRVSYCIKTRESISLKKFCEEAIKIIEENSTKSVLLELNTIQNSAHVYEAIYDKLSRSPALRPLFFLSSQVIPIHRRPRIFQIKEMLEQEQPLVLVSTQVIEAGVDLDFDIVIRDIGPIDSIIQTAGRCNRNGIKKPNDSQVFLYRIVNDDNYEFAKHVYGPVSIDIANSVLEDKTTSMDGVLKQYYHEIKRKHISEVSDIINDAVTKLNYERIEEYFNLIEKNYKEPVFVEFDEKAKMIWKDYVQLKELCKPSRSQLLLLRHEMEQYMIGVSPKDVQRNKLVILHGVYRIPFECISDSYDELLGFIRT